MTFGCLFGRTGSQWKVATHSLSANAFSATDGGSFLQDFADHFVNGALQHQAVVDENELQPFVAVRLCTDVTCSKEKEVLK